MLRSTILGFSVLIPQLYACSCVSIFSKCDWGWHSGETIFLGKTIAMEKIAESETVSTLSGFVARFIIEESFRGMGVPGHEIVVYTGLGGGDCGYPFVPGTSYLVYGIRSESDGHLHANICSETRPEVMAGGVLRELRALRDGTRLDEVFGTIGKAPRGSRFEDLTESKPLAGIPVRATGGKGVSFSTQTDDLGVYAFSSLPAGTYGIEADLPPGFVRIVPFTAEVSAGSSGCRVDHFAKPDGRIEGMVVDATGKAIAGFVTIQPADSSEAAAARQRGGLPGCDAGPDGKFSLPQLPPGRYRLVFHPKTGRVVNFRATFYWPVSPDDAIDLVFGQHIEALQFKVQFERLP